MKKALFLLLFFYPVFAFSTHLRGGEISVTKIDGLNCKITIRVYTNTLSPIRFSNGGVGELDFGDGSPIHNPPQIENGPIPGLPHVYGFVEYSVLHTFPAPGQYTISYFEHNMNMGILNIFNSVETPFMVHSTVKIGTGDYSTPRFSSMPNLLFGTALPFSFAAAPIDSTNRRYKFAVLIPPPPVSGYQVPGDFSVNPYSGLLTWNTLFENQYQAGEYFFWVQVAYFDENNEFLGYVIRAFQIILEDSGSQIAILNPVSQPDGKVVVTAGNQQTIKLILSDLSDSVNWKIYYDSAIRQQVTVSQHDSTSADLNIKVALLTLQTDQSIVRDFPYWINLRGTSYFHDEVLSKDVAFQFFTKNIDLPPLEISSPVTGIHEGKKEIRIYPNPFSDSFQIDGGSPGSLVLINSLGQKMIQSPVRADEVIDVASLSPGVYILQVNDGVSIATRKVVKP